MRGKNTKRVFFNFLPYECGAAEEYFEAMAEKGWLLESIKGAFLKFKRIEPKKVKYSVDILQKISVFDHEDSDAALEYREYCEAAGWNYVCQKGKVQVFYSENSEKIIPIHTDEKEKFKSVLKASLYPVGLQLLLTLLLISNLYIQLFLGAADFMLSTNLGLFSVVTTFSVAFIISVEIIGFILWIIRAGWRIREDKPMPYNNFKQVRIKNTSKISYGILLFLVFLKLSAFSKQGFDKFIIGVLVIMCILMIVSICIQRLIKKKRYSRGANIAIVIGGTAVSIYLAMALMGVLVFWSITGLEKSKAPAEKVALALVDFGYKENEVTSPYSRFDESLLAQRVDYFSNSGDSELSYTIFHSPYSWIIRFDESRLISKYNKFGDNLQQMDTGLPSNIDVYSDNRKIKYIFISEDKVVDIQRRFDGITEDEFLNIVYKKLLS